MTTSNLPAPSQQSSLSPEYFKPDEVSLIKRMIAKNVSDDELKLFLYYCGQTGLNPLARQIYAVSRQVYDKQSGGFKNQMTIQTSIDGLRLVAQRSGKYAGQVGPFWCGEDGQWKDFWAPKLGHPFAAKVGILHKDFKEPLLGIAHWDEYAQVFKNKAGVMEISPMWKGKPALMIAKCAEGLALRKAFPQELQGIYSPEEMSQSYGREVDNYTKEKYIEESKDAPKKEIGEVSDVPF